MKELNNTNYPNHIDQDGKPIVGSVWEGIHDKKTRIITAVGEDSLLYKADFMVGENGNVTSIFTIDNTPHISEPSLQDRVKAKFGDNDTEVVEVFEEHGIYRANNFMVHSYLSRVDTAGFVMHNTETDELWHNVTIHKCEHIVPIAVLLKKGGE